MKVKEAGTDREANVHVRVEGDLNELREYGEFIDPTDNAICCYVPVEEGALIRVAGKFSGTVSISASTVMYFAKPSRPPLLCMTPMSMVFCAKPTAGWGSLSNN